MKPFCEVMVRDILPVIRALIAKNLVTKHGFTQQLVAKKMGTTQPAISQYRSNLRGYKTKLIRKNPEVMNIIENISEKIARDELSLHDLMLDICNLCKLIRSSGMICELHKEIVPDLDKCNICMQ